jgi:hypothetical protein
MMTSYRIALHTRQIQVWTWKTTVLTSLQAVFQLLRGYSALPQDSIGVFTAASKEELHEMLNRENSHANSRAVTAAHFLQARLLQVSGQSTSGCGAAEPAVRQATAGATDPSKREQITTTGLPVFGSTNSLERKRLETESGPGGDYDTPYRFTLPVSTPQLLAWVCLQTRVQAGELQP